MKDREGGNAKHNIQATPEYLCDSWVSWDDLRYLWRALQTFCCTLLRNFLSFVSPGRGVAFFPFEVHRLKTTFGQQTHALLLRCCKKEELFPDTGASLNRLLLLRAFFGFLWVSSSTGDFQEVKTIACDSKRIRRAHGWFWFRFLPLALAGTKAFLTVWFGRELGLWMSDTVALSAWWWRL